jgi:hypothetical protein
MVQALIANPLVHVQVQRLGCRLNFGIGIGNRWGGRRVLRFVGGMQKNRRGQNGRREEVRHFHWHLQISGLIGICLLFAEIVGHR